jgi:hypothetical protein
LEPKKTTRKSVSPDEEKGVYKMASIIPFLRHDVHSTDKKFAIVRPNRENKNPCSAAAVEL